MTRVVEALIELQKIELGSGRLSSEQQDLSQQLRSRIPPGVLERFDRWVGRGKRAVAIVRNGVCSECHLRLPSGTLAALAYTTEMHYCDNCTRLLYLPEDESLGLTKAAPSATGTAYPAPRRSRKRSTKPVA